MESLQTILLVVQVLVAAILIGLILVQHGKGADAGAAFGSGASSTVFGSQGSSNFLTKMTAGLAFVFLANSLTLAYIASQRMSAKQSLMQPTEIVVKQNQSQTPTTDTANSKKVSEKDIPVAPETDKEVPTVPESDVPALPAD